MSIHRLLARMVLAVCLALGATLANAQAQTNAPEALLKRLVEAGQAEKTDLLKALSETGDERARGWLEAVRDGKLAMIEDTGALVIVVNNRGRNWQIADALTGEDLGEMSRRDLQSLRVNNALRADIEGILSVIDLTVADAGQRLAAARNLLGEVNEALATQLQARLQVEGNERVRDMLTHALAIYQVEQGDIEAAATLSGSLNPTVRAALNNAVNSDNPALAAAAEKALASIEQKIEEARGKKSVLIRQADSNDQKIIQLLAEAKAKVSDDRSKAVSDLSALNARVRSSQAKLTNTMLVSPLQGLVQSLPSTQNGGVIQPGGTVVEIVPVGGKADFKARLSPRDIGFVSVGQPTRIKIDAFDYSRFGALKGAVESISPTTSQSERGEIYYEVVVSVDVPYFRDNPESFSILPGMTGEVDITTGEKSVFQYLWKPIYTNVSVAFGER
ncbi:HlyD family type I secretion periplasmic adaptor subunit [uncultured Paraglaciecola sp.]|uniref:HlyD family type I secretion periplasmic adaptor subunit n=1 Tax=uncultured Paraglaciecola sp. TaxID=1765024 RepID=UPI00261445C5|nr:HlyD family type I secretion periplasmic adaptor subunit [uncultured Paraglaciecola sp.]